MPHPGVEYFGWLLYGSAAEAVTLSRCTVNAAGSEWAYGVQAFGAPPLVVENCSFVNFPPNLGGTRTSCGMFLRSSPGVGGGVEMSVARTLFDESFTNAVMFGRLEGGASNVLSVADCIVPRELPPEYGPDSVSGLIIANAALSRTGFPRPDSPSVVLGMGALSPLANDPAADTDGDGLCDYDEVYGLDTDPWLADTDLDGVPDGDEAGQGTDPADPHSFLQNLMVSVTNVVSLSHAAYVAYGNASGTWEANGLAAFPSGFGSTIYTNASSSGAAYVKAFCDLDGDGEFSAATDILLVKSIPQGATANVTFSFGDVDGDGVTDERERADGTDPYDGMNFKFRDAKVSYTDLDHGHGYTNIIALSQIPDGWDSDEVVATFSSATFMYAIDAVATGGVVYVKCLRDLNGDGELDAGTEQIVVTRFAAADADRVKEVEIGDFDGDGIADSQELQDGTDPYDGRNFRLRMRIDAATSDPLLACTNYLAVSPSPSGWFPAGVVTSFVCTSVSAHIDGIATNGFVYVKCLRDFDADGAHGMAGDILYTASLTARSGDAYVMGVGDRDGDGVSDSEEIAEGTDPENGMESCFSLNATVAGIFTPSNGLSAVAYFGTATNILYGPCTQGNETLTVDFGHLSATSREKVSFLFWEDMDGNGSWDSGERKSVCGFRITGHSMCATNVLELGDFDADGDGMLDDWELAHGFSPTNMVDSVQDADGDGFINLYEYIAGTDPNDATENGEGTALYVATHGVDDRIAGTEPSIAIAYYSAYSPQGYGITGDVQNVYFQPNTNSWMHGVDMSCLSVYDDGPQGAWRHPLTAITPQHVISARHVHPENGLRVTFQSRCGDVVVRTLVAQTFIPGVAEDDLWIGLLDSPLPPNIKPAKLLPSGYELYIGSGRKIPLVRIGNNKSCNLHDIVYLAPNTGHGRMCCLEFSADISRHKYIRGPVGMDSGHPLFILFGQDLCFICPAKGFYRSENQATGYLCTYFQNLIRHAVNGLTLEMGKDPMAIVEFDFAVYDDFSSQEGSP